ncbi:hypothetical protein EV426DRAFT_715535 [Tirmania nivea]|nr:hypothetical protein EV426DRAFT_715535 [Tirmania nivea]
MDIINRILPDSDVAPIDAIFNTMRLIDTAVLLGQVFPEEIIGWRNFNPNQGLSLDSISEHNADLVKEKKGIYTVENIGSKHLEDWFTDAIVAQQPQTHAHWNWQMTTGCRSSDGRRKYKEKQGFCG